MRASLVALSTLVLLATAPSGTRAAVRMLPADRSVEVVYVALGDSTVEGVGASTAAHNYVGRLAARLRSIYPRTRTVNLGAAGATSYDVLEAQLAQGVAHRPQLVTLSIGPNDITTRVPAQTYAENLEAILARLARDTEAVVVVNLLPDLAVTPRFRNRDRAPLVGRLSADFNKIVARTAKRHGALVVDLYGASRRELPSHPEFLASDGYHPSDLGYARWAELMWQAVRTRIRS